jgi:uridine kinase
LLDKDILTVKEGKESELSVPFMNWVTDTEEYKIHNVANIDVVLVDGTYTTLLTAVDYRVFINTNFKQTRKNRINRNREAVTPFIEGVLKRESEIIGQHKNLVDLEVDSQFAIVKNNLTTLK